MKIYIVRHGRTDYNDLGIIQGRIETSLNETGKKEAKLLSKKIEKLNIDICISSPQKRAKETALIITNKKIDIIYDDLLKERSFGIYENKKYKEEYTKLIWDYNLNDNLNTGESIKDILKRASIFLEKIKKEYNDKNILIVSHGCFIKALYYVIHGYDSKTDFLSFFPKNTTIYTEEIWN